MTELYDNIPDSANRRAILVGTLMPGADNTSLDASLDELEGLALTADYQPVAVLTQKLVSVNPKTCLGSGKVEELKEAVEHHEAKVVIFDSNLSPAQTRNLEKILSCGVIDRSWLILEIFNDHARTREAKTQVQLAQLKYALPRLTKMWGHLSRQRGGIGMRDVGETQIQLDRRIIRDQIHKLEQKLKSIDKEKITQRKSRGKTYRVTLVGYTNAGKSTLMNLLTDANTLVEDKLFATLDPTTRKIKKNFPYPVLLADTVGLIDKLPHDLVASFKSTLDEVRESDLLLIMVDASHPNYRNQLQTTASLLKDLGVEETDAVHVFNKTDQITDENFEADILRLYPDAVCISCKTETGIDLLRQKIIQHYEKKLIPYRLDLEYSQAKLIPQIRKLALIVKEDYHDNMISLSLRVHPEQKDKLQLFLDDNVSLVAL